MSDQKCCQIISKNVLRLKSEESLVQIQSTINHKAQIHISCQKQRSFPIIWNIWRQINPFPKVVRDYMNIWRQINPFPKAVRDYMEYIKYMKWDIYNYDVGNKVWSLRQNLGVSYGGGVPRDVLEGGALSASLISRHHLNASCCRAGAGYLKHKEAASWPLFWGQLIISPHLSSYSLFSLVVQMLSNIDCINLFTFTLGTKCPGFR